MAHLAQTYHHIAAILSFEASTTELTERLSDPAFDWDAIVVEGSKHLVLPAIYCRLKAKNLLHILPEDLNHYLEELTAINRNRNRSIIAQTQSLSTLFKTHHINHVFLKGTALLLAECYDDIAERMVGDIDILIATDHLDQAFALLTSHGYYAIEQTLGDTFFEHKHLPRLKTDQHICAVELHRKLFISYKDKALINASILKSKQEKNKVSIPSQGHLLRHTVLNYQINDKGSLYNSISFRSAYDSVSLLRNHGSDLSLPSGKVFRTYFNIIGLFFTDLHHTITIKPSFTTSFYLFKLKHLKFYKLWNTIIKLSDFLLVLLKRIPYFMTHKAYRKALYADRRRVFKHFKSVLQDS